MIDFKKYITNTYLTSTAAYWKIFVSWNYYFNKRFKSDKCYVTIQCTLYSALKNAFICKNATLTS